MITLTRAYLPDHSATLGRLDVNQSTFYTLEPPWKSNEQVVSCIPEGVYPLQLRESPVVRRSSKGEFPEGWEVAEVKGRSFIMFHVGNWVEDTDGCILVGSAFSWHKEKGPMITHSAVGFRKFMLTLVNSDFWEIEIRNSDAS